MTHIDIDKIRDIAFNIYAKKRMDESEAISLMKIANILRPNGPLISQTIATWQNKLERKKTFIGYLRLKKIKYLLINFILSLRNR